MVTPVSVTGLHLVVMNGVLVAATHAIVKVRSTLIDTLFVDARIERVVIQRPFGPRPES
jgi:hypothetical protein